MRPEISVVISTFNRENSLARTIESVLAQNDAPDYELIVVDNRSTDATASRVRLYTSLSDRVRYVFEPRQGVAYGRNAGVAQAAAPIIAFTDDDVVVPANWIQAIHAAFHEKPEFGCIGGRVLPRWPAPPPEWLTPKQWAPLALLDYGEAQTLGPENRKCLITANLAMRREVFDAIGGFNPEFQKSAGLIYALEDTELQERYWRAGGRCFFDPRIEVYADVQSSRLQKQYHRRWHFDFGAWQARLHDPDFERSAWHFFGVPGHVLRRVAGHAAASLACAAAGRTAEAFEHEMQARFFAGFIKKRWSTQRGL